MASNSGVQNVSTLIANVYIISNRYPEGASHCQYDTINFGDSDLTLSFSASDRRSDANTEHFFVWYYFNSLRRDPKMEQLDYGN